MELHRYRYKQLFGLTAAEIEQEPIDHFFTNLAIYGYIQLKKADDLKRSER